MTAEAIKALEARIQNYLGNGGFFNPELVDHEKVKTLLMDIRDALKPVVDGARVMVGSALLNDLRAIADTGGRRIETAMDACDKIIELIDMERQLGPATSPAPSDEGVVEKVRKILEEIETETNRATREFHGNSYSAAFAHNRARAALAAIKERK